MDGKTLFVEHGEKIALGVAGLFFLALIGTSVFAEQPADKARDKVERANREINRKKEKAEREAPEPDVPAYSKTVAVALDGGAPPKDAPPWLFHRRPVIETKFEGVELPEPKHFPPVIEPAKGDLGRIGIRWTENGGNHLVNIDGYDVYRALEEPKDWEKVATLSKDQTSYTDTDVKPKVNYFYQIGSRASVKRDHPDVERATKRGGAVDLASEMKELRSDVIGPIRTLEDTRIELISVVTKVTPDEIRQGVKYDARTPSALIKVYRYFPDAGQWLDHQYSAIKIGEKVGKEESKAGKKRDFYTGWKLVETKRKTVRKASMDVDVEADTAVLEDEQGNRIEIDAVNVDPAITDIKKNPRPGEAAEEGSDAAPKKKPGGR